MELVPTLLPLHHNSGREGGREGGKGRRWRGKVVEGREERGGEKCIL